MSTSLRHGLTVVFLITLFVASVGCGSSSNEGPVAANVPASANVTAEQMKQKLEDLARRAEEKLQRELELQERRRGLIEVAFQGFDNEGRIVVSLTNRTGKPIDNIHGGFQAEDLEGNYLGSSGFTIESPGVFLQADQSLEHRPFMSQKPELVERLQTDPNSVRFVFEARSITFMDGTTAEGLEGS